MRGPAPAHARHHGNQGLCLCKGQFSGKPSFGIRGCGRLLTRDPAKPICSIGSPYAHDGGGKSLANWIRALTTALFVLPAQSGGCQEALPTGFVRLREIAPSIRQDIRYAGPFNFTGHVVPGYQRAECIAWDRAAQALAHVQNRLVTEGVELKVYDCYRPLRAVRAFVAWSKSPAGDAMKSIFHPYIDKSKLFELGFISLHSRHSMGIAVDVGLVRTGEDDVFPPKLGGRCDGPFDQRVNESSLDFGTAYDCFSDLSATASPNISATARANRERLRRALEAEGFRNYSREWWHYDFKDSSVPALAHDFPVR
jgi:D-alanyl-D-alanine dipeptidase